MKNILLLSFSFVFSFAFGQTLLYEGFNYTVPGFIGGNLATANDAVGSNNWFTHSNTATTGVGTDDVIAGSLSYTGLAASTNNKVMLPGANATTPRDVNRAFTTATSATTVYYSFLINVIDNTQLAAGPIPSSTSSSSSYFISLGATSGGTGNITSLFGRVAITSSNSGANYRLSISNASSGTLTYTENPVDLAFGTTHLVVVKYDRSASPTVATLWVDPSSLGGTEPVSTLTNNSGSATVNAFASIALRNSSATPKAEIDEIRVGETWASVTPCASPTNYYADVDNDGFGDANSTILACSQPAGYVSNSTDCNDANASINPNSIWYADTDGDGFGNLSVTQTSCVQPTGFVSNSTDCNDNNAALNAVTTWYQDSDGDGYGNLAVTIQNCGQPVAYVANSTDCNDASVSVNPGAVEVYNGIDDNCNNTIDEGFTPLNYYLDNDGDGVGGATFVVNVTSPGPNYTLTTGDCNDNNPNIFPGNTEICDNLDNDCDLLIDEGLTFVSYYQDLDGDSYGNASVMLSTCTPPIGYVLNSTDCQDNAATINPAAFDIPGNGIDEDCSGLDAPIVAAQLGLYEFTQATGCPVLANTVTAQPTNASFSIYTNQGGTCTAAANVFNNNTWGTGSAVNLNNYNEFSVQADSCFGLSLTKLTFTHKVSNVNTIPTWHLRSNVDNYAADIASDSITSNFILSDTVLLGPAFATLNQVTFRFYITGISTTGATWRNDNVGLWGFINTVQPQTFYQDSDGDGFGNANNTLLSCTLPLGYTSNNTDCNDNDSLVNLLTTWFVDADLDGFGNPINFVTSCLQPPGTSINGLDCDDSNAQLNLVVGYYVDADGDGFGDDATGVVTCAQPANTVTIGGDCDDADSTVYPGAIELCDGLDNNCNNTIDEGLPTTTYYEDIDGDTFGSSVATTTCETLGNGFVLITGDCNDNNSTVYPGAIEILDNGVDENCDGVDGILNLADISNFNASIYPNPSNGIFVIRFNTSVNDGILNLTDINGKFILSKEITGSIFELNDVNLKKGIYFLSIKSSFGSAYKRVIIN